MKRLILLCTFILLMLAACSPKDQEPTTDPNAVYTSAAQTVAVQLTQNAENLPTETPIPTQTWTPTTTNTPLATVIASTSSPIPAATQTLAVTQERVEFISQVPGDGVVFAPQEEFIVTWSIKNVGETTWTTDYTLRFFSGDRIGAGLPNSYTFIKEVLPGETYDVTATFKTGSEMGDFQSNWVLTNAEGNNFYPLYITIRVDNPTMTPTITETVAPSVTETETLVP